MEPTPRGETALAAIVFTDVESFTPRMAADERGTLALIRRDFRLMEGICRQHDGQLLKTLGDGLLMYFISAEKAVSCAIAMQQALAEAAQDLPPSDILKHRIGIHLGDVYFNGSDVMGNGVNLAARLQTQAAPGGICISQTVFEVVKNRLSMSVTYLGLRKLKGIAEPVCVYEIAPPAATSLTRPKVFVSYRVAEPDRTLAREFYQALTDRGYDAFMAGESLRLGQNWAQRIEAELQQCDYFLLLLSAQSARSEMVTEEVRRAKELREQFGKPLILPIRVNFPRQSPLNYNLQGYLDRIHQREWRSPEDAPHLIREVLEVLTQGSEPELPPTSTSSLLVGEPLQSWGLPKWSKWRGTEGGADNPPLPVAVPELPEGQVDVASVFYVERPPVEERSYEAIVQSGSLIRIRAPRQMGKTSLMARILHHAKQQGYRTVSLSFQLADSRLFADSDRFFQWFCASIGRRLRLPNKLDDYWDEIFGSKDNCTAYFEEYLLPHADSPLTLGLDEVDCVFQYPEMAADFFGLLRAWHEEAKNRNIWKKLRLVVVHSTEVYVPMDINQSPFNVGLPVELPEFTPQQVREIATLHGLDWQGEVDRLMAIVGGHPYLIRLALYHISRQDLTLDRLLETAPTEAGLYGDHLRRHLWNLQQQPELERAMRSIVRETQAVRLESSLAFKLHSMGLVNLKGNEVVPRSQLYRQYFGERLTSNP
ncbi:MAG: TIR domain-containing protein [Cyanobacteria bacterium J055]|nr:MAG: TIR domain-containing protein [Cyanobacteria bacterium J055]